jgi:hypothetical protein
VFADGFDLQAATWMCDELRMDDFAVLDVLDSLVRKSLVTVSREGAHTRYRLLETIRQFAEDLIRPAAAAYLRDRHARYFASQAVRQWARWDGPDQGLTLDWVDAEFANLRVGFGWAIERGDVESAAAIAAHTAMLAWASQRFEPVGWAEQVLPAALAADIEQLPRVLTAASYCMFSGRVEAAIDYSHRARALEVDRRYDPFADGWSSLWETYAHIFAGRPEWLDIATAMTAGTGVAWIAGRCALLFMLPAVGRSRDAQAMANETLAVARARGTPYWIAWAMLGHARATAELDPVAALRELRQGHAYAREQRLRYFEALIARELAWLEALHGDLRGALSMVDTSLDLLHRASNVVSVAATLYNLTILLERLDEPELAATVYGSSTYYVGVNTVINLPAVLDRLRQTLGGPAFDACVAVGSAMSASDTIRYARDHIDAVRRRLDSSAPR